MKKRKDRIEQEKTLQLTENFRSVKKATTYLGTTVIMGTAGIGLSRTKALADSTVQVTNDQANNNNNNSQEIANSSASTQGSAATPQNNDRNSSSATTNNTAQANPTYGQNSESEKSNQTQDTTQEQPKKQTVSAQDAPVISGNNNDLLRSSVTVYRSPQSFISEIAPSAMRVARQRGLYASMMIAQAGLESGWGSSTLATQAHNLFGVKWTGAGSYVQMKTNEFYGGKNHTVLAKFQKYGSYAESMNTYANLIVGRFPNSTAKAATVEQAAVNLANGRYGTYATDPNYAATLKRIINTYGLKQYDSKSSSAGNNPSTLPNSNSGQDHRPSNTSTGQTSGQYTVKAGDNLYRIAKAHGMSVATLKRINNLSSDNISVGQKLKLSGSASNNNGNSGSQPTKPKPTKPAPSKPSASNSKTHKVQKRDSLWSIAQKYQTSVANLRSWNKLKSDIIYVGQTLKVAAPGKSKQSSHSSKPTSTNKPTNNSNKSQKGSYTVKAHDSLWSIAHSHGLSVAQIKAINKMSSDLIYVGQKLNLSKPQTSKTNANHASSTNKGNKGQQQTNKNNSRGSYTVKSGDSLWSIAQKHNMSITALKAANKLTSDLIRVGQKLQVKGGQSNAGKNKQSSKPASTSKQNSGTYVVKSNDSLWSIANAHNITISKLRQLNHLTGSVIYIGQTLKVQGRSSVNKTHSTKNATTKKSAYIVQSHDSLWRIATRNKMTVNQLKSLNHLVSDTIYVGQKLKLK